MIIVWIKTFRCEVHGYCTMHCAELVLPTVSSQTASTIYCSYAWIRKPAIHTDPLSCRIIRAHSCHTPTSHSVFFFLLSPEEKHRDNSLLQVSDGRTTSEQHATVPAPSQYVTSALSYRGGRCLWMLLFIARFLGYRSFSGTGTYAKPIY